VTNLDKLPDPAAMQKHRAQYPALQNKHYLNFGGQGCMASSSIEAIKQAYEYVQEHGPFSTKVFAWMQEQIDGVKNLLAAEFGGEGLDYALTQNATEGCNIILWGIDWREGDTLLTTDCEHNGVMKAAMQLSFRHKLELAVCKISGLHTDEEILAALENSIARKPRLLMLSHVLWNTGRVLPLARIAEMCRYHGVKLLADGAQSAGVLPLDLIALKVDYYAITGHKWLGGPEGTGALYVAPEALDEIEPTFSGWRGAVFDAEGKPTEWLPGAARFEVATSAFPLLSGLADAIRLHNNFANAENRFHLIEQLTGNLKKSLLQVPGIRLVDQLSGAGLLSFYSEQAELGTLMKILENNNVIIRTIPKPNCLRASLHYFSEVEMAKLVDALG
jgi:L-cysteine/cystine lyase